MKRRKVSSAVSSLLVIELAAASLVHAEPMMDMNNMTMGNIPQPVDILSEKAMKSPGYPQAMQGMMMSKEMSPQAMAKINAKRETKGMRPGWSMGVEGLMTVLRVLPESLYNRVMSNQHVQPGEIFNAIVRGQY